MLSFHRTLLFVILIFLSGYANANSGADESKKVFRVLSIDSGGVRGLIALSALVRIEEQLQKPIAQIFDLIAGSSTGSIIALALTVPDENGMPKYTARQIFHAYEKHSTSIFKRRFRHKVKSLWGLVGPRYKNDELAGFLSRFFGPTRMSQAITPVLATGYHLESEEGVEFYSVMAKESPEQLDCLMKDVAMASSAAPTYFSPAKIMLGKNLMDNIVDGALYAYNPALVAYGQAVKTFGRDKMYEVYSIGTGRRAVERRFQPFKKRGKIRWAAPITGHLLNANAAATNAILEKLLNTDQQTNYFRLNLKDTGSLGDLDEVDPAHMKSLSRASRDIKASDGLREIIQNLKRSE